MAGYRSSRNAEDIKREIAAAVSNMKDPRIRDGLISVVRIEISKDNSFCKVYVSAMNGIETAKTAVKALNGAAGYIRKEISSHLTLRITPALQFYATDSIEYSAKISTIINSLDIKDDDNDEVE
ncbi:MAG: 30S ribosome-binding factor RbfA [Clostridia bacterium]|nr:30S ribosome-binding factor RbfA [Clostridia bacterium]